MRNGRPLVVRGRFARAEEKRESLERARGYLQKPSMQICPDEQDLPESAPHWPPSVELVPQTLWSPEVVVTDLHLLIVGWLVHAFGVCVASHET